MSHLIIRILCTKCIYFNSATLSVNQCNCYTDVVNTFFVMFKKLRCIFLNINFKRYIIISHTYTCSYLFLYQTTFYSQFYIFNRCLQVYCHKNILSRIREPLSKHASNFITVQLEAAEKNFSKFDKMNKVQIWFPAFL
jgi:hypothetical protein